MHHRRSHTIAVGIDELKSMSSNFELENEDLYHLLENEFLPLDLALKVQAFLTKISKLGEKISSASFVPDVQLSAYIPDLEKVATLRCCNRILIPLSVGNQYLCIHISRLRSGTCTIAKSDPPQDVIHRAMYLLQNGFGNYTLVLNNCEDFALYCKTSLLGRDWTDGGNSDQVRMVG
uniref:LRAT domain-containing protein n=1 Tax=Tanacetum cinerariifolium TaxID=118510 RepID=A0A699GXL2_TANCI|nr:hypothetical protein [Tanacetum cinerariifolium]